MKEYVTFGIAKIAQKKGFIKGSNWIYVKNSLTDNENAFYINGLDEDIIEAPTWHQLIDWVFITEPNNKGVITTKIGNTRIAIERLEFWYNHLKDCPLSHEFNGRLLEWFRNNDIWFSINTNVLFIVSQIHFSSNGFKKDFEVILDTESLDYKEAEHKGILEIFELMKT